MTVGHAPVVAIGLALAWLAGVRAYLTLSLVGLAGVLGSIALPASLDALLSPWLIGVCLLLALVECVADKIPGLDSGWDLLQTPVRIPVGAWVGAAMLSADHAVDAGELLGCGAIALSSHAIKSASRRLVNTSPEPLSNWSASLAEDVVCGIALLVLIARPWLGLLVALGGSLLVAAGTAWAFRDRLRRGPKRRLEATA